MKNKLFLGLLLCFSVLCFTISCSTNNFTRLKDTQKITTTYKIFYNFSFDPYRGYGVVVFYNINTENIIYIREQRSNIEGKPLNTIYYQPYSGFSISEMY